MDLCESGNGADMTETQHIIGTILNRAFPALQAVYLFGSFGTADERCTSDVDMALLLAPTAAKTVTAARLLDVQCALAEALGRDVDLVNIRMANVVFQHEVIKDARRILCRDAYAADLFEIRTMSLYQKLNEERAGILDEIAATGRVLAS